MGQAGSLVALTRIDNAKARRRAACRPGCPEVPAARVKSEFRGPYARDKRWSATAATSPSRGRGRGAKADVPGNPVVDRNSPRTPSRDPLRLSATNYGTSSRQRKYRHRLDHRRNLRFGFVVHATGVADERLDSDHPCRRHHGCHCHVGRCGVLLSGEFTQLPQFSRGSQL
jgi:hypothetical protein